MICIYVTYRNKFFHLGHLHSSDDPDPAKRREMNIFFAMEGLEDLLARFHPRTLVSIQNETGNVRTEEMSGAERLLYVLPAISRAMNSGTRNKQFEDDLLKAYFKHFQRVPWDPAQYAPGSLSDQISEMLKREGKIK